MRMYEDECVGCPPEMGCLGSSCPNKNVPHWYCDQCDEELDPDDMFGDPDEDTGHYCKDCAKALFPDEFEEDEDEG